MHHARADRLDLLVAHCRSLDPDARTARGRLDALLGEELAHMLVFALTSGGAPQREPRRRRGLHVRPVLAA